MTLLKFCKTRIVYYENNTNQLTLTNIDTKITTNTPNASDLSLGYRVARIKAADHNWFICPVNNWGLYVKENEWASLVYNNKMIIPKKLNVSLGHSIPTARYPSGTGTATSLSFNNTIFSLIYENYDVLNVVADNEFSNTTDCNVFCRTYDGSRADNLQRNLLPTRDILYKVPDYRATTSDESTYTPTLSTVAGTPTVALTVTDDENQELTLNNMKAEFLPEFLLDNENVKILYPGENQYIYNYDIPETDYNKIEMTGGLFNEPWSNKDLRGQSRINSNTNMSNAQWQYNSWGHVVPRIRNADITRNPSNDALHRRQDDVYFDQSMGCFQAGPPEIYIKGCPILDPSNNLVAHSFLCTVTWELELEVIVNIPWTPRKLIEGWMVLGHKVYKTGANVQQRKAIFHKPYPIKPQPQHFLAKPSSHLRFTDSAQDEFFSSYTRVPGAVETDHFDFQRFDNMATANNQFVPTDKFVKTTPAAVSDNNPESTLKRKNISDDTDYEMV